MNLALAVFAAILLVAGLTLYAVLGGADFGTGAWDLMAGRGRRADRIRALQNHASRVGNEDEPKAKN